MAINIFDTKSLSYIGDRSKKIIRSQNRWFTENSYFADYITNSTAPDAMMDQDDYN